MNTHQSAISYVPAATCSPSSEAMIVIFSRLTLHSVLSLGGGGAAGLDAILFVLLEPNPRMRMSRLQVRPAWSQV